MAVNRPSDQQPRQHRRGEPPAANDEQLCADDAGERHHRAGREVDAARDDDDRRPDGRDAVDRGVLQDQQEVRCVEERMGASGLGPEPPREEGDLEREDDKGAELAHLPELLHEATS
jgi:hypothetical protein